MENFVFISDYKSIRDSDICRMVNLITLAGSTVTFDIEKASAIIIMPGETPEGSKWSTSKKTLTSNKQKDLQKVLKTNKEVFIIYCNTVKGIGIYSAYVDEYDIVGLGGTRNNLKEFIDCLKTKSALKEGKTSVFKEYPKLDTPIPTIPSMTQVSLLFLMK